MTATATLHTNGDAKLSVLAGDAVPAATSPTYRVIRRNGSVTPFGAAEITIALTKAFLVIEGSTAAGSRRVHDIVEELTAPT